MRQPYPNQPRGKCPHWALFAVAAALEEKEISESEQARLRLIIERLRRINPVIVGNVESSERGK